VQNVILVINMKQINVFVWQIVHIAFDIIPPTNVTQLLGNWLRGVVKKKLSTNTCSFEPYGMYEMTISLTMQNLLFMQVIPLAAHGIRIWFHLQPTEKREI
jgi:hypothetical protein